MEFIKGTENNTGTKPKSNVHKSKLNKHVTASSTTAASLTESEKSSKKRRAGPSKSSNKSTAEGSSLKKSSSLDEMSSTANNSDTSVTLRSGKNMVDRTRERRSWSNTEQLQYQFNAASIENLESAAEFRVVTKKKKSKKRRNNSNEFNRVQSPGELRRRTTACSVPHSEKSNDSSDIDSVHSLPVDTKRCLNNNNNSNKKETEQNLPISYASIAKNPQQQQQQKLSVKKQMKEKKVPISPEKPQAAVVIPTTAQNVQTSPPDVHNMENFPTIQQPKSVVKISNNTTTTTTANKLFKNGPKKTNTIPNKTANTTTKVSAKLPVNKLFNNNFF